MRMKTPPNNDPLGMMSGLRAIRTNALHLVNPGTGLSYCGKTATKTRWMTWEPGGGVNCRRCLQAHKARTPEADKNEQFEILEYTANGTKVTVYVLNPGDWFQGFGGSRHTMPVKKTASLIVRRVGPMGLHDFETEVNDKKEWAAIFKGAMQGSRKRGAATA